MNTPKPIIIIGPRNSGKSSFANALSGFNNKVIVNGRKLSNKNFAFNSVTPQTDLIIIDDLNSLHEIFNISMSQTNVSKGLLINCQLEKSFYHKCQIIMVCQESITNLSPGVTRRCDVIDLFKKPLDVVFDLSTYSNVFETSNKAELNIILLGLLKLKNQYNSCYNTTQKTIDPQAPEKELVDCLNRYQYQMDSISTLINKVQNTFENASRIQAIAS